MNKNNWNKLYSAVDYRLYLAKVFHFLAIYKYWCLLLVVAYCTADIAVITLRPFFLSSGISAHPALNHSQRVHTASEYRPILDFNIFHNGDIPESISSITVDTEETKIKDGTPQLSRLPIQLNGTIVYRDSTYSIASITLKSKNKSESYQIGDVVDSLARIMQISPGRIDFVNLNSNMREYLEVSNFHKFSVNFEKKPKTTKAPISGVIKPKRDFKFQVNRSDLNKQLRSLSTVLREAKVVPHWENGKMIGYRFKYIKPGSLYDKQLGFKESDIITAVDGELPKSQMHAARLFHKLRNNSKIDVVIRRKGKKIPFSWTINEDVTIEEPPSSHFY